MMPLIKIGFTGTQRGMSLSQHDALRGFLLGATLGYENAEFHHGDCIGADAQAHDIAYSLRLSLVIHPPEDDKKRAWKGSTASAIRIFPVLDYRDRNRMIVSSTDLLVAAPKMFKEEQRSGTWMTIRMARIAKKPVFIIWPDGTFAS
jgi:hypothetical protein